MPTRTSRRVRAVVAAAALAGASVTATVAVSSSGVSPAAAALCGDIGPCPTVTTFKLPPTVTVCGYAIQRPIWTKWNADGGQSRWGCPTGNTVINPAGMWNDFANRASIYYKPSTGAHYVINGIRSRFLTLGAATGFLGFPTTDELPTADGTGWCSAFENNGLIAYSDATGAHEVHGYIRGKWDAMGGVQSLLRYPTTDETVASDGVGRFSQFTGGVIFWTPSTAAHEVHGAILSVWAWVGLERSPLGYPTTDQLPLGGGTGNTYQVFQGGTLTFNASTGNVSLV